MEVRFSIIQILKIAETLYCNKIPSYLKAFGMNKTISQRGAISLYVEKRCYVRE